MLDAGGGLYCGTKHALVGVFAQACCLLLWIEVIMIALLMVTPCLICVVADVGMRSAARWLPPRLTQHTAWATDGFFYAVGRVHYSHPP